MLMLLMLMLMLLCLILMDPTSLLNFMIKFKELHHYPIFFGLRELFFGSMFFLFNFFESKTHYFERS